ncbi:MAG: hypothetical protein Q8R02_23250 [Hyphomonadaceae bacterium]|nr:hypothetical protein [Hyphomonadaceae bacterium]
MIDELGIVTASRERAARFAARQPHLAQRILGREMPVSRETLAPAPPLKTYRPPSLNGLIEHVAYQMDATAEQIRGNGRKQKLVNARFCIAVLAGEFHPRLSCQGVDDALLRAENMTHWYRERHPDRCTQVPGYEAFYRRCRADVLARMGRA